MAGCTNSLYYGLGYSLGYFAVEALSAIKGVESSMALLERLGLGQDFELAFKDVYDIEWDAAVPILARVIEITAADSPREAGKRRNHGKPCFATPLARVYVRLPPYVLSIYQKPS